MTFQRARSEEQRQVRRRAILDTAAAMLDEMPLADVSLNELSRRVGLAKSNVLRYFDSREDILLELMRSALKTWLVDLAQGLAADVDVDLPLVPRGDQVSAVVARSLAANRVLCDLLGAQSGVLERNVTAEAVARHKRESLTQITSAVDLVRAAVPELGSAAEAFCFQTLILAGALAPYSSPPPALRTAYAADPTLAVMDMELEGSILRATRTLLLGAVPRT